MNKTIKVIYLLMMLLIVNTCVAFAQSEEKNTQTYNWQAFDIGPAEDYNYAFDTNSIKYAKMKTVLSIRISLFIRKRK